MEDWGRKTWSWWLSSYGISAGEFLFWSHHQHSQPQNSSDQNLETGWEWPGLPSQRWLSDCRIGGQKNQGGTVERCPQTGQSHLHTEKEDSGRDRRREDTGRVNSKTEAARSSGAKETKRCIEAKESIYEDWGEGEKQAQKINCCSQRKIAEFVAASENFIASNKQNEFITHIRWLIFSVSHSNVYSCVLQTE